MILVNILIQINYFTLKEKRKTEGNYIVNSSQVTTGVTREI
jgi:hypothetical protein